MHMAVADCCNKKPVPSKTEQGGAIFWETGECRKINRAQEGLSVDFGIENDSLRILAEHALQDGSYGNSWFILTEATVADGFLHIPVHIFEYMHSKGAPVSYSDFWSLF